jgi:hypothetical protein
MAATKKQLLVALTRMVDAAGRPCSKDAVAPCWDSLRPHSPPTAGKACAICQARWLLWFEIGSDPATGRRKQLPACDGPHVPPDVLRKAKRRA